MKEIISQKKEKAVLVAVKTRDISDEQVNDHLDELEELTITAGGEAVLRIIQDRSYFDSAFYIGKGKAEEIKLYIDENDIDLVIFDDDLSAVQVRNLERLFNKKVLDRSGLILDIFALRARTKEARNQVELAQLEYMLPRLTRAWTHLSKQYGGIGTKGPGETQIETDRRIIRDKIEVLKDRLKKIEENRLTQTKGRKDYTKIALVGYTNAGKSTLFNLLTDAGILAEDKLFATLDSTTRLLNLEKNANMLLSDTVGFIRKLPHHLVASFKSTLSEVREADILLHVINTPHEFYEDHINVVNQTLKDLGCEDKIIIKVFNKIDLIDDSDKLSYLKNKYPESILISATKGFGVTKLKDKILTASEQNFFRETLSININDYKTISTIHEVAKVLDTQYDEDKVIISFKADKKYFDIIMNRYSAGNLQS